MSQRIQMMIHDIDSRDPGLSDEGLAKALVESIGTEDSPGARASARRHVAEYRSKTSPIAAPAAVMNDGVHQIEYDMPHYETAPELQPIHDFIVQRAEEVEGCPPEKPEVTIRQLLRELLDRNLL